MNYKIALKLFDGKLVSIVADSTLLVMACKLGNKEFHQVICPTRAEALVVYTRNDTGLRFQAAKVILVSYTDEDPTPLATDEQIDTGSWVLFQPRTWFDLTRIGLSHVMVSEN